MRRSVGGGGGRVNPAWKQQRYSQVCNITSHRHFLRPGQASPSQPGKTGSGLPGLALSSNACPQNVIQI